MIIKTVLIHGLALFAGFLASGLSLIILMPCAVIVQRYKSLKLPFSLFTGSIGGLMCFYVGVLIFNWLDIKLTFWLLLFYVVFTALNANKRFDRPDADKILEWGWLFGEIIGLIFGAHFFGLF